MAHTLSDSLCIPCLSLSPLMTLHQTVRLFYVTVFLILCYCILMGTKPLKERQSPYQQGTHQGQRVTIVLYTWPILRERMKHMSRLRTGKNRAKCTWQAREPLKHDSSQMENAKGLGRNTLERATSGEAEMTAFNEFSVEITTCLRTRSTFQRDSTYRLSAARREKLWIAFHQLRLSEIPKTWDRFLSSQHMQSDKLLQQPVTQKLFEMLLHSHFSTSCQRRFSQHSQDTPLSKDELNVLQCACGYVPHALLQ